MNQDSSKSMTYVSMLPNLMIDGIETAHMMWEHRAIWRPDRD